MSEIFIRSSEHGPRKLALRRRQVSAHVRAIGQRSPRASGRSRPSGSTGSRRRRPDQEHQLRGQRLDPLVRGRRAQRLATTASTAISTSAATRSRSSGKATIPAIDRKITYRELHDRVCRLANVLKAKGVKKGDRVTIYLPMIPEAAYRDAGLRPDRRRPFRRLRRLLAGQPRRPHQRLRARSSLITADGGLRGGKTVPLKEQLPTRR